MATATTVPQSPPAARAGESPAATIQQHYALIDARRYADGYQLMSRDLQALNSPADYAGWFANKVHLLPVSVEVVSQTDSQAVVRSVVDSTDLRDGQPVTSRLSEQFVLTRENGAWRIDQVRRL